MIVNRRTASVSLSLKLHGFSGQDCAGGVFDRDRVFAKVNVFEGCVG